jgi:hypothetical protein
MNQLKSCSVLPSQHIQKSIQPIKNSQLTMTWIWSGMYFFGVYKRAHCATFLLMKKNCDSRVNKYFSTRAKKHVFDQNNFSWTGMWIPSPGQGLFKKQIAINSRIKRTSWNLVQYCHLSISENRYSQSKIHDWLK